MLSFKRLLFPIDVILVCIRWYAAYPLSYRHIEEMMGERGVLVEHSTINRWDIRFLPLIEELSRKRKVGSSWRMDETYIKVIRANLHSIATNQQYLRQTCYSGK